MNQHYESFPLHWPSGYKRTIHRQHSLFKQGMESAQQFLRKELERMGAKQLVISTNIPVRKDGGLYTDYMSRLLPDPGVAIYFKYKDKNISMCCDRYIRVWENIYALGKGIEALRGMDRWGVSEFMERAFTGFTALPESVDNKPWYEILGIQEDANEDRIKSAYRALSMIHHPDKGGTAAEFNKIKDAYDTGMERFK